MKKAVTLIVFPAVVLWLAENCAALQTQAPIPDPAGLVSLMKADKFLEADRLAASLLKSKDLNPQTLALCGLAMLKAGRIDEAEAVLKKAVALAPENPEAHLGLGRISRARNHNDKAIFHLEKAVSSTDFLEEALRHLWRTVKERGIPGDLNRVRALTEQRYFRDGRALPSWIDNSIKQLGGREDRHLYRMEGSREFFSLPLLLRDDLPQFGLRMISLKLNGKSEYPFDIDSALVDFMTVSPLLAEELGLALTGNATATGVGTRESRVRFAVLDQVEMGPVTFYDVPVQVSDIATFQGLKKGLIGTALLKRFNITIDFGKKVLNVYPLERPDLLAAAIDRKAVAADIPLYCYDQTVVAASVGRAPESLYILDTAAATVLSDTPFFDMHIRPKIDPARMTQSGIQGAGGAQQTIRVEGLSVTLGPLLIPNQAVHVFAMETLNEIGERYTAGLLGNPVLWSYRVHMDFKNGRLILEKR